MEMISFVLNNFNNRELAFLSWAAIVIFYFVLVNATSVNKLAKSLLKAILSRHILSTITLMAGYMYLLISLLRYFNIWDASDLKTTIIWFFFSGILLLKTAVQSNKNYGFISETIKSAVSISVVIEFILRLESFSYPVELLMIPILALILGLSYQAENMNNVSNVQRFLDYLIIVIFLVLLIGSINNIFFKSIDLFSIAVLKSFSMPIVLTICFLPFLIFISVYSLYQFEFVRLNLRIRDKKLRRLAIEFLESFDILAGKYNQQDDGIWFSSAPLHEFGEGFFPNNIGYYISGERQLAKKLILKLNINEPKYITDAKQFFIEVASVLVERACEIKSPKGLTENIQNELSFKLKNDDTSVKFHKEEWNNNDPDKYSLVLKIKSYNDL